MDDSGDNQIIQQVLSGNADSFEVLIDRYHSYVFAIVGRKVPVDEVDEVAHTVFIKAYKSLASFKRKSGFQHWIGQIAARTCYDFWRKRYRNREITCSQIGDDESNWMESVMNATSTEESRKLSEAKEAHEVLHYALAKLSPKDRSVLTLTYIEGRSTKEAAQLLGWTQANIKVRTFRARAKLKTIIENALNGGSV